MVPVIGDGNCLFRANSYCWYGSEDRKTEICLIVVDKVIKSAYNNLIIGDT